MHVNQRRRLAVEERGTLPTDLLGVILNKADVESKLACALAGSALRQELLTYRCWPQEVRLDLHDSRQFKWLRKHITVMEKLSIFLEYSLIGKFNCLLRRRGAPHLTSLSIHMSPDQAEDDWTKNYLSLGRLGRGFFELRGLRLVDLRVYHSASSLASPLHCAPQLREFYFVSSFVSQSCKDGSMALQWDDFPQMAARLSVLGTLCAGGSTPVLLTHNLPTTLRKLTFGEWQDADVDYSFRSQAETVCLCRYHNGPWSFAHLLPAWVTHLRLMCSGHNLLHGLTQLKQCCNLEELDVYVSWGSGFAKSAGSRLVCLARALESLCAKRVGLHVSGGDAIHIPDCNIDVVHRTCFIGNSRSRILVLEDHMDHTSRRTITKLKLHVRLVSSCPSLSGFSALKELVIADSERFFGTASTMPLSLGALEVVAATLRHLTVSSNSEETRVELPQGISLRSFVCVCRGHLLLECDAHMLSQGLEDVILGYTTVDGTGVRLVQELTPRLGEAVLEVLGPQALRQCLLFTRPGLVGEWWHGVFQVSKEQFSAGCLCCTVRVWAQGHLCPLSLTCPRYGITSVLKDRKVLYLDGDSDESGDEGTAEDPDEESGDDEDVVENE